MGFAPSAEGVERSEHEGQRRRFVRWFAQAADRWRVLLSPLAGLLFFGLALWALHRALSHHSYREIVAALDEMRLAQVALALLLTAAGYLVLTGYDLLGFRFIGRKLPVRQIAFASFIGYAFGNNVGNTLLTGAAVRYWIYTSLAVPALEIAKVIVFCSAGFWLGYLCLGAVAFALEPIELPVALHLPFTTTRPLGIVLFALLAAYGLLVARRGVQLRLGQWQFSLPSPRLTAGQVAVATLDLVIISMTLWVLLPPDPSLPYFRFLPVFMVALLAGTVSQVPGGLGVFETVVLLLLPYQIAQPTAVAALVAFRGIYYLAPSLVALTLVAVREGRAYALLARGLRIGRWASAAVPQIVALAVFVAGTLLLVSGALPAASGRLAWLAHVLSFPVIEASHFLASLVGMMLLLLARGLQRRLDAAYVLTLMLLVAGMLFSLAKGFDYEEAIILGAILAALAPCRRRFYRRASLFSVPLTWGWVASIAIVLAGSLWLYAFAFQHVEYVNELWWRFAVYAEAPRALRATVGAVALGVLFAAARLLRPARPPPALADEADIERARPIVAESLWTYANLVFRRDKALLFSPSGDAFLMYGRVRRSCIAMGDPIGPRAQAAELAWQFRDLCDRHGEWPVFSGRTS